MPGKWNPEITKGNTWDPTILYERGGIQVIPTDAVLTVYDDDGSPLLTLSVLNTKITIDGAGLMTILLSDGETDALTWRVGSLLLRVTDSTGVRDLVVGTVSVVDNTGAISVVVSA